MQPIKIYKNTFIAICSTFIANIKCDGIDSGQVHCVSGSYFRNTKSNDLESIDITPKSTLCALKQYRDFYYFGI